MKWSELEYNDFYIPFDENQRAIRGFWLTTLGIDLENLPDIFTQPFLYFEHHINSNKPHSIEKVYLTSIVGTSHKDYGGMEIIKSYTRIKRARHYITRGCATQGKYFHNLKKITSTQEAPIILSKNQNNTYFVDCNGNHRIILYKMMMLSEIAVKYPNAYIYEHDFTNRITFSDVTNKYWLYAKINSF